MRQLLLIGGLIPYVLMRSAAQGTTSPPAEKCSMDRMPVYRPDLSRVERMPTLRPDTLRLERMPILRGLCSETPREPIGFVGNCWRVGDSLDR